MKQAHRIAHSQTGAALITALVLLTIMTLLAVTSMGTNTLEEKMAANAQETNRAFQTAETGLQLVLADDAAFDTNNKVDDNGTPFVRDDDVYDFTGSDPNVGDYNADTVYTGEFRQKTPPKRAAKSWNAETYSFYHFDLSARGATQSGASTTLHAGAYQVGPK
jgi:Tfp pilus assembly protein PilX